MNFKSSLYFIFLIMTIVLLSCDPHIPPSIEFKTGGDYLSADATVPIGSTIKVGIIGKKKEDDMKTFNVSFAYDGATSTTTKDNFRLSGDEEKNYDKDYSFTVRNQAGVEDWYFVITDRDGNIAKLTLKLTVN